MIIYLIYPILSPITARIIAQIAYLKYLPAGQVGFPVFEPAVALEEVGFFPIRSNRNFRKNLIIDYWLVIVSIPKL